MPNKPRAENPARPVRVEDELWNAAKAAAKANDTNVSEVIREALRRYVNRDATDQAATLAQVVYDIAADHPMWIGDDGEPLDYLPERESRISDFVEESRSRVACAGQRVADGDVSERQHSAMSANGYTKARRVVLCVSLDKG